MKTSFASLLRFLGDETGTTSVEYASMLSLIILTVNVSVENLATRTSDNFNQANSAFTASDNNGNANNQGNNGNGNGNGNNGNNGNHYAYGKGS